MTYYADNAAIESSFVTDSFASTIFKEYYDYTIGPWWNFSDGSTTLQFCPEFKLY